MADDTRTRRDFIKGAGLAVSCAVILAACGGSAAAPAGGSGSPAGSAAAGSAAASSPSASASASASVSSASVSSASVSSGSAKKGSSLVVRLNSDIIGIDPQTGSAGVDRNVYTSVYDGLVVPDTKLNIVPSLAESWTNPNAQTYVFKLRQGVRFHDGTPFDATAAKLNFDWMLDPANASQRRQELAAVKAVTVVDPTTLTIELKSPSAPFLATIADRAGYFVSPAARKKFGKDYPRHPVGTGPFTFVEWVKDDHVKFARNPSYWQKGLPLLRDVTYRPVPDSNASLAGLETGTINFDYQVDPKDVGTIKGKSSLRVLYGPGVGYQGLWLNLAKGPMSKKPLREAVAWAVDREALLKVAYLGYGAIAYGPLAPAHPGYDPSYKPFTRDLAKARAKLAEGGQPKGFSMTLKSDNSTLQAKVTQLIQAQLKEAGIDLKLEKMDFGALLNAGSQNNFDMLSLGWSGRIDPDGNIEPIFQSKGAFNYGKYHSPTVDGLIAKGAATLEKAKRGPIYRQIQKTINDDVAYIFTYQVPTLFATTANVKHFPLSPDDLMRFTKVSLG
ncbi:MAG: ABC transporter substrate-binding protein [Chloroflexota bacterium]